MTEESKIPEATDEEVFLELKKEHQDFVVAMRTDGLNQTKAYMKVYPDSSEDAARAHSSRLVANGNIQAALRFFDQQSSRALGLNDAWVKKRLMMLANGSSEAFFDEDGNEKPWSELTEEQKFSIGEVKQETRWEGRGDSAQKVVTKTIKMDSRKAALTDLGKMTGALVDRKEHSGPGGGPIENRNTVVIDKESFEDIVDLL